MNCPAARHALLDADLPIDAASDLGRHLHECPACARVANALSRDLALLGAAIRLRGRRRTRHVTIVATMAMAAASVVVVVVHAMRESGETSRAVNGARPGVVSIEVPADKMATVLQTSDPNVTVVWLTDAPRNGS